MKMGGGQEGKEDVRFQAASCRPQLFSRESCRQIVHGDGSDERKRKEKSSSSSIARVKGGALKDEWLCRCNGPLLCRAARRMGVASASRRVSRVCSSNTAMLLVNTNIGQSIKNYANYEQPSYTMKRCSRILHRRRTVPSASYQCRGD